MLTTEPGSEGEHRLRQALKTVSAALVPPPGCVRDGRCRRPANTSGARGEGLSRPRVVFVDVQYWLQENRSR
jgi:hypothetical protein